jgi:hypothetical protein
VGDDAGIIDRRELHPAHAPGDSTHSPRPRWRAPNGSSQLPPGRSKSAVGCGTSCQPHPAAPAGGPPAGSTGPEADPRSGRTSTPFPACHDTPPRRCNASSEEGPKRYFTWHRRHAQSPSPARGGSVDPQPGSSIGPDLTRHSPTHQGRLANRGAWSRS